MIRIISTLLLTLLLSACSGIPYDENTSHTKISTDLKINEEDIIIISKCNFYPFQYGKSITARMRRCLFITDDRHVLFVNYNSDENKYFPSFKIPLKEIKCAAVADKEPGKGITYLYTTKNAITVALLHYNNDLNHEAVRELTKILSKNSIPVLDLSIAISNPLYDYEFDVENVCPLTIR